MSADVQNFHDFRKTILWGILSIGLYALLWIFEKEILTLTTHGRWLFIVPVAIAFLFSFVHGHFTAEFWDSLGIQAKK
ncbi:MAG: hypothetical protein HQL86_01030 [Magnetococcales bacterium]|nr:hypothetical protein [Magnetococcales bacterium]